MKIITTLLFSILVSVTVAQNVPVDFEEGGNGADWTWAVFENDDNPALEIVANPSSTGINTSTTVAKFTARQTGNPWAGCESLHGSDIGNYKIDATNSTITIMVYKSVASDVGIKLVTSSGWSKGELKVANTLTNQWEELTFDFSGVDHENMTYDQIVVFMDFNARAAETVNYFDNLTIGGRTATIKELDPETVSVYPNPVKDLLHITSNQSAITSYELVSSNGVVVKNETVSNPTTNKEININNVSTGVYTLKVNTQDGVLNKKLFIK